MVNGWTVPGFTHSSELGGGTTGRVVLAVDDLTQTQVAIKYLDARLDGDEAFMSRFRLVARRLSQLEDPNVVDFFDFVESPKGTAIVMERADGVTLRRILGAKGPTGPLAALSALGGTLLGLAAAHELDIVHGAIRPANIVIDPTGDEHGGGLPAGNTRLTDFALAPPGTETATGPAYAAPELWDGGQASVASDIYAVTAVFFECLTGRPPFTGRSLAKAHRDSPIPVEEVPGPLRNLIAQGLAKEPEKRPASAADFLEMVENAAVEAYGPAWEAQGRGRLAELARESADAPEPKPARTSSRNAVRPAAPAKKGSRKRKALTGVLALVLIGGGVAGAATLLTTDKQNGTEPTRPTTSGAPQPVPTPAVPAEATTLADQIDKALAVTPTAAFSHQAPGTRAHGSLTTADSYALTMSGTGGTKKAAKAVLVKETFYLRSGKKWRTAPITAAQGYPVVAARVRAGASPLNIAAILRTATAIKKNKQFYEGTAPTPQNMPFAALARTAPQVKFAIVMDKTGRPWRVRLTVPTTPRPQVYVTTYTRWNNKPINAPKA